ncbi:hypothetical protein BH10PSE9_BH10PSE9_02870 [soil metagenome]
MIRAAAILALAAIAGPATAATVSLGNMSISYDETRWSVSSPAAGETLASATREPGALRFVCMASSCRKQAVVWASAVPAGTKPPACKPDDPSQIARFLRSGTEVLAAGPLQLNLTTTHSGCRAYTPAHRRACGSDAAYTYAFDTGTHLGCGGIEGVSDAMFRELLGGISFR